MPRKINGKPFSQVFLCRHATAKGEAPGQKKLGVQIMQQTGGGKTCKWEWKTLT